MVHAKPATIGACHMRSSPQREASEPANPLGGISVAIFEHVGTKKGTTAI